MFLTVLELSQLGLFFLVFILSKTTNLFKRRIEILFLASLTTCIYVLWRIIFTIPHTSILSVTLGWILLSAEIIGLIDMIPFYMIIWGFQRHKLPLVRHDFNWPTVDIFIATYNESSELLLKTVWACKGLDYPDKEKVNIFLCDDGHRDEIKELAKELGVQYLNRNGNKGAKAGNLNNAMMRTSGQLVVTFDADMIPNSKFLMKTVPYMQDIDVGFVQTPQAFYNEDILRYDLFLSNVMPDEQDFFNRVIQEGRASFNASIYSGSNTLFRRHAIQSIGGFVEGTITEDFATGMMIQAKGWKSKYHNEVLAVGLSPETMEDLIQQRVRWGRGVVQTFKRYNPLTMKGLALSQRILYLNSLTYWFSGLFRYVYFGAPLVYGLFGVVIFNGSPISILSIWLPNFLAARIVFNTIVGGYSTTFWRNAFDTVIFPHISTAVMKELFFGKSNLKFKVTPKDKVKSNKAVYKGHLIFVQLIFSLLSVLALLNLGRFEWSHFLHHNHSRIINDGVNMFWVAYNLALLLVSVFVVRELPRKRGSDRFNLPATIHVDRVNSTTVEGIIDNVSETGVSICFNSAPLLSPKDTFTLHLHPHTSHIKRVVVDIEAEIISYEERNGLFFCALKFINLTKDTKQSLNMYLFNRDNVVSSKPNHDFSYTSFITRYWKTSRKINSSVILSRKSPRLEIKGNSRVGFKFIYDSAHLPLKISNVNHSHVLVEGKFFPEHLEMITSVNISRYDFNIVLEKNVSQGVALYRLDTQDDSLIEGWFNHISEAQQSDGLKDTIVARSNHLGVGDLSK